MRTKATTSAGVVLLVCCMMCSSLALAQQKNNLEYKRSAALFSDKKYFLNDERISKNTVADLLKKENEEAYKVFQSARTNMTIAYVIGLPAGFCLGYGATTYLLSGVGVKEEPALLIAGIVGVGASAIFAITADKKFKKAADIYDHGNSTGNMHLNIGPTQSGGLGFTLSF